MKRKWLWLGASTTLILVPLVFWLTEDPKATTTRILVLMAFLPLAISSQMETKVLLDDGDEPKNGSPVGNVIAKILLSIVVVLVIWGFYSVGTGT